MKSIKNFLFTITLSLSFLTSYSATYEFRFDYGIGMDMEQSSLCFYQLKSESGVLSDKIPLNVSNGKVVPIKLNKKKIQEIIFSGYYLDSELNKRRSFLGISRPIANLNRREVNNILIVAATEEDDNFTPVAELLRILSNKEYNELLNRKNDEVYGDANTFPIGRFILYNPDQNISKDVIPMPSTAPPFVQNSRAIYDHYILRKQLGVDFNAGYQKLSVATQNGKQQFIEYSVKIDTMRVLNWISPEGEMKFLYDQVNKGNLDWLNSDLSNNQNWKLYFVSSCIEIKNFLISSQVFDSLASVTSLNVDIPVNASDLTIKAGVVYGKYEGSQNTDHTFHYFTGFNVRDYTKNIKDFLAHKSLQDRIDDAEVDLEKVKNETLELYADLRKLNLSIIEFGSTELIVGFFEKVEPQTYLELPDLSNADQIKQIEMENGKIRNYNIALEIFKEKIVEYKNSKNYLDDLSSELVRGRSDATNEMQPNEIKVDDAVVENAIVKKE